MVMLITKFFRCNRIYLTEYILGVGYISPNYVSKCYYSTAHKIVLGIETSCDDTGCAIVTSNRTILGDFVNSQIVTHLRFGGINPIIAQELHRDHIEAVVDNTLKQASLTVSNIDAIAVTVKPGLRISLEVGVKYGKYLAGLYGKPFIPIHHMEAHALVARIYHDIDFPFLVLLISGGHCQLAIVKDIEDFILIGESIDDAPGEACDKTARRMKLRNVPDYAQLSGGKAIETAAAKAKNPYTFKFPLPLLHYRDCNFSFSGLKDAVSHYLIQKEEEHGVTGGGVIPEINELCSSFQLAITEHLMHRTLRAMVFSKLTNAIPEHKKVLVVSGGVASNDFIFKYLKILGNKMGYEVYRPPPKACTDNGIMIAWNGIEKLRKGYKFDHNFDKKLIDPKSTLGKNAISEVQKACLPVKPVRCKNLNVDSCKC